MELCLGRAAEGDPPRHGAVPAPFVELVEEVDEGADEGLVGEEGLRLRGPQQRLVQDQLLVPQLVGVLGVDLQGGDKSDNHLNIRDSACTNVMELAVPPTF